MSHIKSTLNAAAWGYYLREYPNQSFVSTISHIIHFGASLGFVGDHALNL